MNYKKAIYSLFILGILFGGVAIFLAIIPVKTVKSLSDYAAVPATYKTTVSTTNNYGLGSVSTGIISACCFLAAANLIIKSDTKNMD